MLQIREAGFDLGSKWNMKAMETAEFSRENAWVEIPRTSKMFELGSYLYIMNFIHIISRDGWFTIRPGTFSNLT